ncbi:FAD-dependent oxidoreductase [Dactylosporangium sp. AC04546]|uniref:FAD-dependent oxidoreductase n=1 Tax=Dactylosporangium sp. AC04546 TaxID=2862460 RepID=UPI001EDF346E|nr:FAD-dependent oxidoreductase [Dactylosporangium sp. AC04546]WVK80657.1 FAD-dependent oxidoreductase [Dactylosporangium sp. AC04546]
MTTIKLYPDDVHNQRTIRQGHPPDWVNRGGGDYDLVVLGGGPGGLTAATTAAAEGHRVAMTEQRLTGGTCVNFGCTPSKALIRCARAVHDASRGAEFGFRLDAPPRTDFGSVMDRVRRMRSLSSSGDAVEMAEQAGVEVYLGHTRFTAPDAVEVDGRTLRFGKAVIATGSDPVVPPIEGLRTGEYLTNETVFSLTELPARLVVIGSGPLGCELAQAFRRLGSEVDLVSHPRTLLPHDEPEAGELIRRRFEQEGIRLHLGFRAVRAGAGRLLVQGPDETRELPYDALLLGTGRKANVEHLDLGAAGVHVAGDGVEVDAYLRTRNPNVYAAGDATFPQKFTHAANATARLCIANALDGAHRPARELVIPHCTYTDPEVAEVGLTPRRARDEGVAIDAYRLELAKVERAFIDGEEEGFGVIYTRSGNGEIAGATLVAAHAGEMISELTLAVTNQLPLEALASTVHCYPTQAEVFQRIALQHAGHQKVAVAH